MSKKHTYTRAEVESLVNDRSISDVPPWSVENENELRGFYLRVLEQIQDELGLQIKVDWDQGSGYASYVEFWLYRPTSEFALPNLPEGVHGYAGLQVLLCRLAPVFVFIESARTWTDHGGSHGLACAESVDLFESAAVVEAADAVQMLLQSYGLTRLVREDALLPIDDDLGPYTLLGDYPYKQFDALFHWMD